MVTSLCANMCAAVQQRAEPVSPFVSPWVVRYDKVPSLYRLTLRRGSQVSLKWFCGKRLIHRHAHTGADIYQLFPVDLPLPHKSTNKTLAYLLI